MRLSTIENKLNGRYSLEQGFTLSGIQENTFFGGSGKFPFVSQQDPSTLSEKFTLEKIGFLYLKSFRQRNLDPFLVDPSAYLSGDPVVLTEELRAKFKGKELQGDFFPSIYCRSGFNLNDHQRLREARRIINQRFYNIFPDFYLTSNGRFVSSKLRKNANLPKELPCAYFFGSPETKVIVKDFIGKIEDKKVERGVEFRVYTNNGSEEFDLIRSILLERYSKENNGYTLRDKPK